MVSRDDGEKNSWTEHRLLVLSTLEAYDADLKNITAQLNTTKDDLQSQISDIKENIGRDLAILQTKAALWGGIAALIVGSVVTFLMNKVLH